MPSRNAPDGSPISDPSPDGATDGSAIERSAKHVVILLHGILTFAEWQERIERRLKDIDLIPFSVGYQWFALSAFLLPLPWFRLQVYNWIDQQIRDARRQYPNAHISVIAHSFGTYVLGHLLANTDHTFYKIFLCGSVLPEDFSFIAHRHKIGNQNGDRPHQRWVVNHCGEKDIWPVMAWFLSWWYGKSGRFGFKQTMVSDHFHAELAHKFFDDRFTNDHVLPFFRGAAPQGTCRGSVPLYQRIFGYFRLATLVAFIALTIAIANLRCIITYVAGDDPVLRDREEAWASTYEEHQANEKLRWSSEPLRGIAMEFKTSGPPDDVAIDVDLLFADPESREANSDLLRLAEHLNKFYQSIGREVFTCRLCNIDVACGRWHALAKRFVAVYGRTFANPVRDPTLREQLATLTHVLTFGLWGRESATYTGRVQAFVDRCEARYNPVARGPSTEPP
jgi:hypothetical protein